MALYAELLYNVEPLVNKQCGLYTEHCMRDALYFIIIIIYIMCCSTRVILKTILVVTVIVGNVWIIIVYAFNSDGHSLINVIVSVMRTHVYPPEANWQ